MKEIKAYIKPHRIDDVVLALHRIEGLTGVSVSDVRGFGRGRGQSSPEGEREDLVGYIPHAKIEIACAAELVEKVVSAIEEAAHTGLRGDGKIYVSSIEPLSGIPEAVKRAAWVPSRCCR